MFPPPPDLAPLPPGPPWVWLTVGLVLFVVFALGLWKKR